MKTKLFLSIAITITILLCSCGKKYSYEVRVFSLETNVEVQSDENYDIGDTICLIYNDTRLNQDWEFIDNINIVNGNDTIVKGLTIGKCLISKKDSTNYE